MVKVKIDGVERSFPEDFVVYALAVMSKKVPEKEQAEFKDTLGAVKIAVECPRGTIEAATYDGGELVNINVQRIDNEGVEFPIFGVHADADVYVDEDDELKHEPEIIGYIYGPADEDGNPPDEAIDVVYF